MRARHHSLQAAQLHARAAAADQRASGELAQLAERLNNRLHTTEAKACTLTKALSEAASAVEAARAELRTSEAQLAEVQQDLQQQQQQEIRGKPLESSGNVAFLQHTLARAEEAAGTVRQLERKSVQVCGSECKQNMHASRVIRCIWT